MADAGSTAEAVTLHSLTVTVSAPETKPSAERPVSSAAGGPSCTASPTTDPVTVIVFSEHAPAAMDGKSKVEVAVKVLEIPAADPKRDNSTRIACNESESRPMKLGSTFTP